jgi:hypothetical protein
MYVPSVHLIVVNCVMADGGAPCTHMGQRSQLHLSGGSPHADPVRLHMGGVQYVPT